jgi:hypothetical protein
MPKKYDNNSRDFSLWTTAKLKKQAKEYYSLIYTTECFGTSDLINYDQILRELFKRNIELDKNI